MDWKLLKTGNIFFHLIVILNESKLLLFQVFGNTYSGSGPSKQIAKNICAEQAIQAVVAKKSQESREKIVKQKETGDQVPTIYL